MVHSEILKKFQSLFPEIEEEVEVWFPNGRDSIRLRERGGLELVFSVHGDCDWSIETLNLYIDNKMRGGEVSG